MRWMAMSSTEEDSRVYCNARVFVALRQCLDEIPDFYQGLHKLPQFQPNEPHVATSRTLPRLLVKMVASFVSDTPAPRKIMPHV
jgi:hypothetical protein